MTTTRQTDWAESIGDPAFAAIAEMVAALQCDYERLEELREERDDWEPDLHDGQAWPDANPDEAEELEELESDADDCESEEDARERIDQDPLSLEVRSGWTTPGQAMDAEEYCLLLTTGGPAVRIIGNLESGEPTSAVLQVQDWGMPWTEYPCDQDILMAYAECFCFGD